MIKLLPRGVMCAGLIQMGLSASAFGAALPDTGLGQAWPSALDVSANAHWHVYRFESNGIHYIQINDLHGKVRGAFATANGQFLILPMGRDAQRISTPQQPLAVSSTVVPLTTYTETVYRDASIQLDAVPLSDGSTMFTVQATTTSTAVAPCDNPIECSTHAN